MVFVVICTTRMYGRVVYNVKRRLSHTQGITKYYKYMPTREWQRTESSGQTTSQLIGRTAIWNVLWTKVVVTVPSLSLNRNHFTHVLLLRYTTLTVTNMSVGGAGEVSMLKQARQIFFARVPWGYVGVSFYCVHFPVHVQIVNTCRNVVQTLVLVGRHDIVRRLKSRYNNVCSQCATL